MTTATDIPRHEKAHKQLLYVMMMESFIRNWTPADYRLNAEFNAQLHALVRQIYEDAAEPWRSHMERTLAGALTNFAHPILKMEPRP